MHPVPFNLYDPFGLSKGMSAEKKEKRLVMEVSFRLYDIFCRFVQTTYRIFFLTLR